MNSPAGQKSGSNLFPLPPRWADVLAAVAGVLLPFAFSPFGLFPLAIVAPALLFISWQQASPGRAALRGFLFGLGMFGVGVSWVYVSMHRYGNMPAPLAGFAVFLFVAGLALYPALYGWLQARFFSKAGWRRWLLVLPALWVFFEWVRGWFLTGFPWLHLGYSQLDTPLAGYAGWLGVYGVSYFCALGAGLLAAGFSRPAGFARVYMPLLLVIGIGGWMAGMADWSQPVGKALQVSLIQGNVPLASKWQPKNRGAIMNSYLNLSARAPRSDLIVWPESALPMTFDQIDSGYLGNLRRISQAVGVDFLIGVIERENNGRYYNSVVSIGSQPGAYRKRHLVPFGEYPPLDPLFRWLMQSMQIPMSDFSAGSPDQPPLTAAGHKVGVSVCYEDAFGEEVIRALPEATLLVNVSEDAWFGESIGPHQRLQMARMRALETGRPMLRADNTGLSAVIDHRGEILALSPQFEVHTLTAAVQPMRGATPYVRYGNYPVVLLMILLMALAALPRFNRR